MKKLAILCALMYSCASQKQVVEIEYIYDQETGKTTIIEHYIAPEDIEDTYCPCGKYGDYIPCAECKE